MCNTLRIIIKSRHKSSMFKILFKSMKNNNQKIKTIRSASSDRHHFIIKLLVQTNIFNFENYTVRRVKHLPNTDQGVLF